MSIWNREGKSDRNIWNCKRIKTGICWKQKTKIRAHEGGLVIIYGYKKGCCPSFKRGRNQADKEKINLLLQRISPPHNKHPRHLPFNTEHHLHPHHSFFLNTEPPPLHL